MSGSASLRIFLYGRLGLIIVTAVVTGLLVFLACFMVWSYFGGGAWCGEVEVMDAELRSPLRLTLFVASCNENPTLSLFQETDVDVQVKVAAFSTPLRGGGDCQDTVEVQLREPLGDRVVIDKHTGRIVLNRVQVELNSHRNLWRRNRLSDYTYEYNVLCECSDKFGQTVKITVMDHEVESVVYAVSGKPPVVGGSPRYHTIDTLFDLVQDAISNEADQLTVSYDTEFGYPTNIEIDYSSNSVDDEYSLTANAFTPR